MAKTQKQKPKATIAGEYLTVAIDKLTPDPANYNRTSDFMMAKLEESIRRFGFTDPIIVRERDGETGYTIIGGEHRWKVAQKLGMKEVPIVNLGEMDDERAHQLLIVLNETKGSPDDDALAALVRDIKETGGDEALEVLPYTDAQLSEMLDLDEPPPEDDDLDDQDAKPSDGTVKLKPVDVTIPLELEGAKQGDYKKLIEAIRRWRSGKSEEAPAWRHLLDLLHADTIVAAKTTTKRHSNDALTVKKDKPLKGKAKAKPIDDEDEDEEE